MSWKFAGKSLLFLGQFEKAQQCLTKAHQLDATDPETTQDIGNTYLNLGSTDNATKWYKKSLEINNSYAPAFNNLANIKRQSGNTQEAIDLFKRAIQIDPQLIQAYVGAAASLLALRDLDQAEALATKAIEINAHAPGINEILGIIFQNKDSHEKAIEHYRKELAINPKANNLLLDLGLLLLQTGQAAEAVEPLVKASANNPSEQSSLLLAQAYQNLGQFKEAILEYKKLDIDQSKNKKLPFNLGLCLLNTGSNIEAIEAFKLAIKIDESYLPAWGNIGNALKNEGRHHEALLATQKVLDLDPDNPTAHMNLGGIYKDLGKLDQALASTLKSLELRPDNPTAHMNLGNIYQDLGNLDQALASTLKSLELNPHNHSAFMNLGCIYKDLGNLDQALASTLKSLKLNPDNPYALMNLGSIYKDLGNLDQALASTLKSLELKPDNPTAHMNLGGIYKDCRNLDQALASTLKSLELKPDNPDSLTNLGSIYHELGEYEHAIASYNSALKLNPRCPNACWNLSLTTLLIGNYKNGWEYYEYRLRSKQFSPHMIPELDKWDKENFDQAKQLLIVCEQGIGDTIQFLRYIKVLQVKGITIRLCVEPKLHSLIKASGIDPSPLNKQEAKQITEGQWMPLLSIPRLLGVCPENPIFTEPYIKTTDEAIKNWARELSDNKRPIIGINWKGNRKDRLKEARDIPIDYFTRLDNKSQSTLLSLQRGSQSSDLNKTWSRSGMLRLQDKINKIADSNDPDDLLEYAAIIANCDLVMTTETTVAHIAGSMGITTWIFLPKTPHWRWGLHGYTSFWYPSVRLFRQKNRGNWDEEMKLVTLELEKYFKKK
nr:tetratricopeptide repeat protein [Synechococcus sp. AH-551-E02]